LYSPIGEGARTKGENRKVFLGFLSPFHLAKMFRLAAARRRYRNRPGPKEAEALAGLLVAVGDRAEALGLLRKARAAHPRSPEIKKLHDSLWAQAAGAEIDALERRLRTEAKPELHARLIELHRSVKNFDRCMAASREAERKFPDSWMVRLAIGKALYHRFLARKSREDGKKAAEYLREAARRKPDCTGAYLYLATLLSDLGMAREAASAAEELLRLVPKDARARRLRDKLSVAAGIPKTAASRPPAGGAGREGRSAGSEVLGGLIEKLQANRNVYGAFVFGSDGSVLVRHGTPNEHFAFEGHDGAIAALGRSTQAAAERMGIGRLHTCTIEGDPWRIYFGDIGGGGVLAVLSGRNFDPNDFESLVTRFSLESVNR
jgi:tetratricopeptide (TPR) repeat protein